MSTIHPTALVDAKAQLGENVSIGPYSIVGPDVTLGDGTELQSHVHITGDTVLGKNCTIFPFASVGSQTQDLKFKGGTPGVRIGDNTTLREYVTVNAATNDGNVTVVGNGCHIMAYVHVAHDCIIGNQVIMANCATLAGHIVIEDQAIIGGLCGIHQFVRIGRMSIIGGCSKVVQDVPPFMMADGHPLAIRGLNKVGMKRKGLADSALGELKNCHRVLYRQDLSTRQALEELDGQNFVSDEAQLLIRFVKGSERGITH